MFETVEPFIRDFCFQAKLSGICLLCPGVFNPALQPAFDTLRDYHATFRGPLVLLPSRQYFSFYIMSPLHFRQAVRGTQHSSSCHETSAWESRRVLILVAVMKNKDTRSGLVSNASLCCFLLLTRSLACSLAHKRIPRSPHMCAVSERTERQTRPALAAGRVCT